MVMCRALTNELPRPPFLAKYLGVVEHGSADVLEQVDTSFGSDDGVCRGDLEELFKRLDSKRGQALSCHATCSLVHARCLLYRDQIRVILTIYSRRVTCGIAGEGAGFEHVQRRDSDALAPVIPRLRPGLLELPYVAGTCVEQHRDEEEIDQPARYLAAVETLVLPLAIELVHAGHAAYIKVLPPPMGRNVAVLVWAKVALHHLAGVLSACWACFSGGKRAIYMAGWKDGRDSSRLSRRLRIP